MTKWLKAISISVLLVNAIIFIILISFCFTSSEFRIASFIEAAYKLLKLIGMSEILSPLLFVLSLLVLCSGSLSTLFYIKHRQKTAQLLFNELIMQIAMIEVVPPAFFYGGKNESVQLINLFSETNCDRESLRIIFDAYGISSVIESFIPTEEQAVKKLMKLRNNIKKRQNIHTIFNGTRSILTMTEDSELYKLDNCFKLVNLDEKGYTNYSKGSSEKLGERWDNEYKTAKALFSLDSTMIKNIFTDEIEALPDFENVEQLHVITYLQILKSLLLFRRGIREYTDSKYGFNCAIDNLEQLVHDKEKASVISEEDKKGLIQDSISVTVSYVKGDLHMEHSFKEILQGDIGLEDFEGFSAMLLLVITSIKVVTVVAMSLMDRMVNFVHSIKTKKYRMLLKKLLDVCLIFDKEFAEKKKYFYEAKVFEIWKQDEELVERMEKELGRTKYEGICCKDTIYYIFLENALKKRRQENSLLLSKFKNDTPGIIWLDFKTIWHFAPLIESITTDSNNKVDFNGVRNFIEELKDCAHFKHVRKSLTDYYNAIGGSRFDILEKTKNFFQRYLCLQLILFKMLLLKISNERNDGVYEKFNKKTQNMLKKAFQELNEEANKLIKTKK